ncbi:hypothetical protein [Geoalkalibacter subterraneus]|uniref:Lipoprotein n=1 Tax=Geoalkalibacter subterraneus TaxID=483547 RepID=A0A0B5FRA9_9BACT|nr:hypothetical protein [Geoalkalibacter subterraneus]AJF06660.1 hypothetical protein GSUB_09075 [Geoalkalibacter subterraneus]
MRNWLIIPFVFLFLCSCAGVNVVPKPGPGMQLDETSGNLAMSRNNLTVTARIQDLQVRPYQAADNLCSFFVTIRNDGETSREILAENFLLIDENGTQYRSIPPSEVLEILSRDSFYLIPYPYVGFYYLEDSVKVGQFSQFDSSLPYFPQRYPQELHTAALPSEKRLLPGNRLEGQIYFIADLTRMKSFELQFDPQGTSDSPGPEFSFSFSVEKK